MPTCPSLRLMRKPLQYRHATYPESCCPHQLLQYRCQLDYKCIAARRSAVAHGTQYIYRALMHVSHRGAQSQKPTALRVPWIWMRVCSEAELEKLKWARDVALRDGMERSTARAPEPLD
jgi:hypothetical protein